MNLWTLATEVGRGVKLKFNMGTKGFKSSFCGVDHLVDAYVRGVDICFRNVFIPVVR